MALIRNVHETLTRSGTRPGRNRKRMLKWNSKLTFIAVLALLVALAVIDGNFSWHILNFSW
jgi:hypothetical protein